MRVRALSMTSALVLAAAGAVALPTGVATAAAGCCPVRGFYANNDAIQDTVVGCADRGHRDRQGRRHRDGGLRHGRRLLRERVAADPAVRLGAPARRTTTSARPSPPAT